MNGKTIRIYLVDGDPKGILTAEIINWIGKVLVAPRSQLAELAKREELKRTGVYCLVGPDPDNLLRDMIYVGEGDSVRERLVSHLQDPSKEFWTRCFVVVSKDPNLTKAMSDTWKASSSDWRSTPASVSSATAPRRRFRRCQSPTRQTWSSS